MSTYLNPANILTRIVTHEEEGYGLTPGEIAVIAPVLAETARDLRAAQVRYDAQVWLRTGATDFSTYKATGVLPEGLEEELAALPSSTVYQVWNDGTLVGSFDHPETAQADAVAFYRKRRRNLKPEYQHLITIVVARPFNPEA